MDANLAGLFEAVNNVVINGGAGADPDLKSMLAGMHNVIINGGDATSFNDMVIALGSVFMCVALPVILIFGRRKNRHAGPFPASEQASAELWERARRMETRIEYLERVLDSEMPGWRNRS